MDVFYDLFRSITQLSYNRDYEHCETCEGNKAHKYNYDWPAREWSLLSQF